MARERHAFTAVSMVRHSLCTCEGPCKAVHVVFFSSNRGCGTPLTKEDYPGAYNLAVCCISVSMHLYQNMHSQVMCINACLVTMRCSLYRTWTSQSTDIALQGLYHPASTQYTYQTVSVHATDSASHTSILTPNKPHASIHDNFQHAPRSDPSIFPRDFPTSRQVPVSQLQ